MKPKQRHLIMDVTGWRLPISGRYLCGHDEQHWFVASLPFDRRTATVRGAVEALKPAIVLREQKRKGVKHRRQRRKTAAYVRQGEWFFLPRPNMHVGELAVRNGQLVRGGGKPHRVEWLYRPADRDETFLGERFRTLITRRFTYRYGTALCKTTKPSRLRWRGRSHAWHTWIKNLGRRTSVTAAHIYGVRGVRGRHACL